MMVNLIQQMTNALIQIVLFMLLPFIWWFVTARRKSSFLDWIGFKPLKDTGNHKMWLWIFLGLLSFTIFSYLVLYTTVKDLKTATSSFAGLGFQALPAVLIYSLFQTSLPEELLFRGFLLKRFCLLAFWSSQYHTSCSFWAPSWSYVYNRGFLVANPSHRFVYWWHCSLPRFCQ